MPVETLISKNYARKRSQLINPARALRWDEVPSFGSLAGNTIYIAAVDRDGNSLVATIPASSFYHVVCAVAEAEQVLG